MATVSLEERVTTLETELAELKRRLGPESPPGVTPWWERIFGTFANSSEYEEAMRLGREYRESLRPSDDEADGG
jgi:hypothetical protein